MLEIPRGKNKLHSRAAQYMPEMRGWLMQHVRDPDAADDVLQEMWLRLASLNSAEHIGNVRAYLYQVARSVLADRARRDKVRKVQYHKELDEADHPVDELDPERIVTGRESVNRIVGHIEKLPERTRDIFILSRFENASYAQIANIFGISVSAVEKHIINALRQLMEAEGQYEF